jgi:hypothetical protein
MQPLGPVVCPLLDLFDGRAWNLDYRTIPQTSVVHSFFTGLLVQEKQSRLASFPHRLQMCELAFHDAGRSSTVGCPSADRNGETNASGRPNANPHPPPRVAVSDAEYRSWEAAVEQARAKTNLERCPYVIYVLKRAVSCRHLRALTR